MPWSAGCDAPRPRRDDEGSPQHLQSQTPSPTGRAPGRGRPPSPALCRLPLCQQGCRIERRAMRQRREVQALGHRPEGEKLLGGTHDATMLHSRCPFVLGPRARTVLCELYATPHNRETDLLIQSGTFRFISPPPALSRFPMTCPDRIQLIFPVTHPRHPDRASG
jgi:hypothetical protein